MVQVINDIQRFQQEAYPFARLDHIQDALEKLPTRPEMETYNQSMVIEPRAESQAAAPVAATPAPTQTLVELDGGRYKVEFPADYPFRDADGPTNIVFKVRPGGKPGKPRRGKPR